VRHYKAEVSSVSTGRPLLELVGLAVSPGTRIASGNDGFGVHVIAGTVVSSPSTESLLL